MQTQNIVLVLLSNNAARENPRYEPRCQGTGRQNAKELFPGHPGYTSFPGTHPYPVIPSKYHGCHSRWQDEGSS